MTDWFVDEYMQNIAGERGLGVRLDPSGVGESLDKRY